MAENNEDYIIDDTKLKYRTEVPDFIYNAFIKVENMKNRLVLAPKQINQMSIPLQSADSTTNENYVAVLEKRTLYDLQMVREAKIEIVATGLTSKEDPLMYGLSSTTNPDPEKAYCSAGSFKNNGLGLASALVPGLFGLTDDYMNKCFSNVKVSVGNNGTSVSCNLTRNLQSIMNRMLDPKDVFEIGRAHV